jgi:23S rRNA (cytosine1962-C5)-methyltransferase
MLLNRLRKRRAHLRKWARRRGITCYRVYEKDMPDQPMVLDWYDGHAVVWLYDRRRDDSDAAADAWRESVLSAVREAFEIGGEAVFVKERGRQRGLSQYERIDDLGFVRSVQEGGLAFEVNLSDYLDTGLFLDHRVTRGLVREMSDGKDVLNLFAYTGSFSCYAAAGGARSTVTVDMSNTYCEWAERNLALNGFTDRMRHTVVRADCLRFLAEARTRGPSFDVIVLDPPTFSNSKRMRETFSVSSHAASLIADCDRLLRPGGTLWFSTNDRGFELPATGLPPLEIEETSHRTVPEDFRNRRIHRSWRMHKPGPPSEPSRLAAPTVIA